MAISRIFKEDASGATMVECAIVLSVFLGVLFFTLSFCGQMYQYVRIANALRVAGRLTAIEASAPGTVPLNVSDCNALVRTRFEESLGNIGLPAAPNVTISVEQAGAIRGLRLRAVAEAGAFFSPIHVLPTRISREAFIPLEDQAACQ